MRPPNTEFNKLKFVSSDRIQLEVAVEEDVFKAQEEQAIQMKTNGCAGVKKGYIYVYDANYTTSIRMIINAR